MNGTELEDMIWNFVEDLKTLHSELKETPGRIIVRDDYSKNADEVSFVTGKDCGTSHMYFDVMMFKQHNFSGSGQSCFGRWQVPWVPNWSGELF